MSQISRGSTRRQEKRIRLLIVEDNPDHSFFILKAIQESFSAADPVLVTTEETALEYLERCAINPQEMPLLVLLDLYFPTREKGLALLRAIKDQPAPVSQVPVVVFSSSSAEEDISDSYEQGVNSYVVKPMSYDAWREYFQALREYWMDVVSLPDQRFTQFL
ncbi:response regulator [Tellurirhabdus rosea]|uniref:response regulator n=1 Tax=Tellurirhabdus rosea TaxID=2674997 RepID=UPI00224EFE34|nr:response regulator [Tellurirhabdus rosea]